MKILSRLFFGKCPNCISAYTGGHPDPYSLTRCMVCGDPKNGARITGRTWRWSFLARRRTGKNLMVLRKMGWPR